MNYKVQFCTLYSPFWVARPGFVLCSAFWVTRGVLYSVLLPFWVVRCGFLICDHFFESLTGVLYSALTIPSCYVWFCNPCLPFWVARWSIELWVHHSALLGGIVLSVLTLLHKLLGNLCPVLTILGSYVRIYSELIILSSLVEFYILYSPFWVTRRGWVLCTHILVWFLLWSHHSELLRGAVYSLVNILSCFYSVLTILSC